MVTKNWTLICKRSKKTRTWWKAPIIKSNDFFISQAHNIQPYQPITKEPSHRTKDFKDKSKAKKFEPLDFIKMQHIVASILNVNVS